MIAFVKASAQEVYYTRINNLIAFLNFVNKVRMSNPEAGGASASGGSKESQSESLESITRDFSLTSLASSSHEEVFRTNEHAFTLLKHLQCFYENKQLTDVVLIAGIDGVRYEMSFFFFKYLNMFPDTLQEKANKFSAIILNLFFVVSLVHMYYCNC